MEFSSLSKILEIGIQNDDSKEIRLQKSLLIAITIGTSIPGMIWAWIYYFYGEPLVAIIPFGYSILGLFVFLLYQKFPENYDSYYMVIRLMILFFPFLIMIALGGFIQSSIVIVWSMMAPLTSLLIDGGKHAKKWFFAFLGLILIGVLFSSDVDVPFPNFVIQTFIFLNIIGMSLTTFFMSQFAVKERTELILLLSEEKKRSEDLLLNVLPKEVIPYLQESDKAYVEEYESVSVLFADIVGFTGLTETLGSRKMLDLLNLIFSYFDSLLDEHNAEKIRTIGDNYMVSIGAPVEEEDHAFLLVSMAQKMLKLLHKPEMIEHGITFRIGINSGPVVAGVIGKHKFHWDVWSDMVNIASRLESTGIPGQIQIGPETFKLLNNRIPCTSRGPILMKGKGEIETYLVS
ncbi:MAG: Adenylate cyclase [Candidatus Heimdallarchaeota archaeon LC_2]|nr:MAG: Adenylate cyclase [Candidatus Heimdallarchaeota archaeon LC_2]